MYALSFILCFDWVVKLVKFWNIFLVESFGLRLNDNDVFKLFFFWGGLLLDKINNVVISKVLMKQNENLNDDDDFNGYRYYYLIIRSFEGTI